MTFNGDNYTGVYSFPPSAARTRSHHIHIFKFPHPLTPLFALNQLQHHALWQAALPQCISEACVAWPDQWCSLRCSRDSPSSRESSVWGTFQASPGVGSHQSWALRTVRKEYTVSPICIWSFTLYIHISVLSIKQINTIKRYVFLLTESWAQNLHPAFLKKIKFEFKHMKGSWNETKSFWRSFIVTHSLNLQIWFEERFEVWHLIEFTKDNQEE